MDANTVNFHESFIHREHRVLGVKLRPLTLRHYFALVVAESAFVCGGIITWPEVLKALAILRLQDPLPSLSRLKIPFYAACVADCNKDEWLDQAARKLSAYVSDYASFPERAATINEDGTPITGKVSKTPWLLRLVESLRRAGWSESPWSPCWPLRNPLYVWDLPIGEAYWRAAAIQELDGAELDIIDEDEAELIRLVEESE